MQLRVETRALVAGPSSGMIALVSAASRPLVSRVWGAQVLVQSGQIRVLADPEAPGLRAAAVPGHRVAVVFAACDDYRSVQIKGAVAATDDGFAPGDAALRSLYRAGFIAANVARGFSSEAIEAMEPPTWFGITLDIEDVFDQTPRQGAGAPGEPR